MDKLPTNCFNAIVRKFGLPNNGEPISVAHIHYLNMHWKNCGHDLSYIAQTMYKSGLEILREAIANKDSIYFKFEGACVLNMEVAEIFPTDFNHCKDNVFAAIIESYKNNKIDPSFLLRVRHLPSLYINEERALYVPTAMYSRILRFFPDLPSDIVEIPLVEFKGLAPYPLDVRNVEFEYSTLDRNRDSLYSPEEIKELAQENIDLLLAQVEKYKAQLNEYCELVRQKSNELA